MSQRTTALPAVQVQPGMTPASAFEFLAGCTDLLPNLGYWEQDAQHRITRMIGPRSSAGVLDTSHFVGRTPWEAGGVPREGWSVVRPQFERHEAFDELLLRYVTPAGVVNHISHTLQARFDSEGRFLGYHGVFKDVTRRIAVERQMALEHQVATQLAQGGEDALVRVLQALVQAMGWRQAVFWRLDTTSNALRNGGCWPPEARVPTAPLLGSAESPNEMTQPLWTPDLAQAPNGLRCGLSIPVNFDGAVLGVVEVHGEHVEQADPQILHSCLFIGTTIGQFLERERLEQERLKFHSVVDSLPDMVYVVDRETMRFVYVNATACNFANFSYDEFMQLGPQDVLPNTREHFEQVYDELIANPGLTTLTESISFGKGGGKAYVAVSRRAMKVGDRWCNVSISRDITPRKLAERAAERSRSMYAALSATNEAILHSKSPQELFDRVCAAAVDGGKFLGAGIVLPDTDGAGARIAATAGLAGLRDARISVDAATPEGRGLVGVAFRELKPAVSHDFLKDERTAPWHTMASGAKLASAAAIPLMRDGIAQGVLVLYSKEKRSFDPEVMKLLERMSENVSFALVNFGHEEERRRGQDRIAYMASHDALTGLPNRTMFGEMLNVAIHAGRRYGRKFAVMFIDLDRFKHINDSLGHAAGDELLKEMSSRFKTCLRSSDVVARMGGDEFVVLVQEIDEPHQVATVARKILAAALQPVHLAGQDCRVTASVGISMFPSDAQDEPTLMKNADMAMYEAKAEGKNNYQFFTPGIRAQSLERLALETQLRSALDNGEFTLHYQPKLDIGTDAITGVEALLRWTNPVLGAVSPGVFIPLAEETGLIVPIGRWVLRSACEQSAAWQRAGLPKVGMAVNLSARQFADDGLVDDLRRVLADTGVDPQTIELEITESMVISNSDRALRVLRQIKSLGVRLAIDDFGTGYSSLAQLKNFPVDTLKVDRSFIRDLPQSANDRAITEAIISVGKSLCLNVVAEGVETTEQLEYLRASACNEMQGYYFSKPIAADALAQLLTKHASVVRC